MDLYSPGTSHNQSSPGAASPCASGRPCCFQTDRPLGGIIVTCSLAYPGGRKRRCSSQFVSVHMPWSHPRLLEGFKIFKCIQVELISAFERQRRSMSHTSLITFNLFTTKPQIIFKSEWYHHSRQPPVLYLFQIDLPLLEDFWLNPSSIGKWLGSILSRDWI